MKSKTILRLTRTAALMVLLAGMLSTPAPAGAANLLVNSANDNDDGRCDARHCSLREAINAANADPGWDRIDFNIPGAGPHTITLGRALPAVTDNQTWIIAASEPDFTGQPVVTLDGHNLPCERPGDAGWVIESDDNIIRGFSIVDFPPCMSALKVTGNRNEIEGNFVGIAPSGLTADTCDPYVSGYRTRTGIDIYAGDGNIVRDNVISCNVHGLGIGLYPTNTIVQGNLIGTDPTGAYAAPNEVGLMVHGDSTGTQIGGDEPSGRNLISGNETGIQIFADDVRVSGNYIGTNADGSAAIPNDVGLDVRGINHTIGGDGPGQGNLISGNTKGIWIQGEFITLWQNRIGTDAAGGAAIPNGAGIMVEGPGNVAIGGPAPVLGNLVAFSRADGILINRPRDVNILGNTIHSSGQNGIDNLYGQDILIRSNTIYSNAYAGVLLGAHGTLWHEETVQRTTISQNSLYENGRLGIQFALSFVNGEIVFPSITSASRTSIAGTACAGCTVEVFLSDRDPSGLGEGKTYLTSVTAGPDGAFTATFPEVANCESLTTTATDADGNTSAFSFNRTVGICVAPPPIWLTAMILIVGTGGGSAFMPDIPFGCLRLRGALRRLLGGLAGLVGGSAVLAILALILGNVQARQTEEPLPSCSDFLNENLSRPPSGAAYDPGTDVLIELSPQPDPPGSQSQWRFEVTEAKAGSHELTRATPSVRLSEFGFDPLIPGDFFWQVTGERLGQDGQTWQAFCEDGGPRLFSILPPTPTPTAQLPTSTSTPTPTVTPTPTLPPPIAIALQNAFCRYGPSQVYEPSAMLNQGQSAPIQGRNNDDTWWFVLPEGERYGCWVWAGAVDASGDLSGVPRRLAPPTPTPTPYACWVAPCVQCAPVCTFPCPPNATPGGVCMP